MDWPKIKLDKRKIKKEKLLACAVDHEWMTSDMPKVTCAFFFEK